MKFFTLRIFLTHVNDPTQNCTSPSTTTNKPHHNSDPESLDNLLVNLVSNFKLIITYSNPIYSEWNFGVLQISPPKELDKGDQIEYTILKTEQIIKTNHNAHSQNLCLSSHCVFKPTFQPSCLHLRQPDPQIWTFENRLWYNTKLNDPTQNYTGLSTPTENPLTRHNCGLKSLYYWLINLVTNSDLIKTPTHILTFLIRGVTTHIHNYFTYVPNKWKIDYTIIIWLILIFNFS